MSGFVFVWHGNPTPQLGRWQQREETFRKSTCLLRLGGGGCGGSSFLPELHIFPRPHPTGTLRGKFSPPHPQPPLSEKESQKLS